ncbi:MAG: type VI secretion system tip protein VgrG [Planctomycetes bacterium]|nr:type VI secretion system tip protein VgrG [Planctomycetota bacterium]
MALTRDLSKSQLTFQLGDGDVDRFQVIRYRGSEGLSQLFRFEIELASSEPPPAFTDVVGKRGALSIVTDAGERFFHGIISRFELTGETAEQLYFRVELVPMVWLLTHRYNSRIFQNQTVKDIITAILTEAGIPSDRFKLDGLTRTYEPREYCVQYRETDFNFIARLMEEEGIWWCFEHTPDGHTFVAADGVEGYKPVEGEPKLPYKPPTGMDIAEEHVFRFRLGQAVRPGKVVLNDFNFEKPTLNLEVQGDVGRDTALEFSDYPGEYLETSAGQALAKLRAEEFESTRILGVGQSNSHRLLPGRTFELAEHPAAGLNAKYLVISAAYQGKQSVLRSASGRNGRAALLSNDMYQSLMRMRQHEDRNVRDLADGLLQIAGRFAAGDETAHRALTNWLYHAGQVSRDVATSAMASGGNPLEALSIPNLIEDLSRSGVVDREAPIYECRFECIPSAASFRPPRVTPWPVMRGAQTARVVGPSGEEIYTDKYGRVKVQFNWDRQGTFNENSSCWIRVSQGLAGGQYGMMFLPRVGQEVIVDFLEGDPDKPLIVGRVYNADHLPPYTLPDEKTKSTIKSNSSKGGGGFNEIRFEDLKDSEQIFIHAQKDLEIRIKNDEKDYLERDKHEIIGRDQKKQMKRDDHRTVERDQLVNIKRDRSLKIGGKDSISVGGQHSLSVDGDVSETFKSKHSMEVTQSCTIKAMEVVIDASTGVTLKCGGNFVKVSPAGVDIVGTLTKINSGGAGGSPSIVSAVAPQTAAEPEEAAKADPGKDTTYSKEASPTDPLEDAPWHNPEEEPEEDHWIGIRLWDDNGQPLSGERYRVVLADGTTVASGTLNAKGEAYIQGIDPGSCQVTFPDLDALTWETGPATGGEGGAAGGGGSSAPTAPGGPSLPV